MTTKAVPPCQAACPVHTDVRGYVTAISKGDLETAIRINRQVNPFPFTCGRVCARPCESVCRRAQVDEPIAIAALKRFAADNTRGINLFQKPESLYSEKVAVIGSGPAGLAAAHDLALLGYKVTVFEAQNTIGGMLREGIPEFRLPKDIVKEEIDFILSLGIETKTGLSLSRDFSIEGLLRDFHAVLLAIGSQKSLLPKCKGIELSGIIKGVEFLKQISRGERPHSGKSIVVIGGGHTAVDAARTCFRLGFPDITIVYRRSIEEMPANREEIEEVEKEGIKIMYLTTPVEFLGDGKVEKVRCIKMKLCEPDESGRPCPKPIENSEFEINANAAIFAIGYIPEKETLENNGLIVSKNSRVIVDETGATNIKGIFACGDVVSGPSSLIKAIASGKKTAKTTHCYLRNLPVEEEVRYLPLGMLHDRIVKLINKSSRQKMPTLPIEKRINSFAEVELGYNWEQALMESQRCLKCGTSELAKQIRSLSRSKQSES
jgi:NADPH-dependent glutamate synthase beta subunit-like oxidoreductase